MANSEYMKPISTNWVKEGQTVTVRYAARQSKTDRNGHKHSVRPVSTRFLLNYEAKRWS